MLELIFSHIDLQLKTFKREVIMLMLKEMREDQARIRTDLLEIKRLLQADQRTRRPRSKSPVSAA